MASWKTPLRTMASAWGKLFSQRERLFLIYKELEWGVRRDTRTRSRLPLTVVIPTTEKDFDVLPFCVEGIRAHLKHPIHEIALVAPASDKIQKYCRENSCTFVEENQVVDYSEEAISLVVDGRDRSKWLYQQFLKLESTKFVETSHYLVLDSDTVLVRDQVYESNGKVIMNFSDEYHAPYFLVLKRLFPQISPNSVSYTSHQMLFSVSYLKEMKQEIEDFTGLPWRRAVLEAITKSEHSAHSDYETYGQWVQSRHRSSFKNRYWFNASYRRAQLSEFERLKLEGLALNKSISFHSWNTES